MAGYTLADGSVAVHARTLTAGTEDTVAVPARLAGVADVAVLVHPESVGPVYVTAGAASAAVSGANCRAVWPGYAVRLDAVATVRLISASADIYSVEIL